MIDNPTAVCGRCSRYPDVTGKRTVEGGTRLQGEYKKSLPGKPLVSVITTVFNCVKYIEQAMLSVFEQTYENIEYIVIDAASDDGTINVISRYENMLDYYISEPDTGIYDGMNKGVSLATGDYVIVLNADDYYTNNAIELLVQEGINSSSDIVAAHSCNIDEDGYLAKYGLCRSTWTDFAYLICPLKHETMLVKRDVYNRIGYYNDKMKICADWFWMAQAYDANCSVSIVSEELLVFRKIGISSSPEHKELHFQERISGYTQLFKNISAADLDKLKSPASLTPEINKLLIKNNPQCKKLHKALDSSSIWAYASGVEGNKTDVCERYLYYPNLNGVKRLASGGVRLEQKKIKRSLPDKPLVTVITTVFNCIKYCEQAIHSVLEQTYDNIEYIIIDAASIDGTIDIIKKYRKHIDYYISEPDSGIYAGMNKGVSLAGGDYVIILNADDYYKKDAIEKLVKEAIQTGADIVAAHASVLDEKDHVLYVNKSRWTAEVFISSPLRHETMLISKKTYNDVGYYGENRKVISDRIWMMSAYEQKKTVSIVDEAILMFRKIGASSMQSACHEQESNGVLRNICPAITQSDMKQFRMLGKLKDNNIKRLATKYSNSKKIHDALLATIDSRASLIGRVLPAISVQIPVYNAEKYLAECLDSILLQTFTDFEVICVDDGSTDSSVAILNEYANKDTRILIFQHEVNKGTLQARKTAFEQAEGKYMIFVDADDITKPNMFEELYSKAAKTYIDLVQCGAAIYDPQKKLKKAVFDKYQEYFTKVHDFSAQGQKLVFSAFGTKIKNNFWVSIIRKKVYKQIIPYLPDSPIPHGNDNLVMFMLIYFSHTYASLDKILYMYRASDSSSNLTVPSVGKVKAHIQSRSEVFFCVKRFMEKVEPNWCENEDPFLRFGRGLFNYTVNLMERCLSEQPDAQIELLQCLKEGFGEQADAYLNKINIVLPTNTVATELIKKEPNISGPDVSKTCSMDTLLVIAEIVLKKPMDSEVSSIFILGCATRILQNPSSFVTLYNVNVTVRRSYRQAMLTCASKYEHFLSKLVTQARIDLS